MQYRVLDGESEDSFNYRLQLVLARHCPVGSCQRVALER